MYSLLRIPHPPTGVEHSVEAHFFGPWERNLVVSGANVVRVFRLVPDDAEAPLAVVNEQTGEVKVNGRPVKMRLECVASFSLDGEISDMQKVTLPGGARDTFLLAFPDAKLSVVEYDPETHGLRTLSLHVFEDDASRDGYVHNHFVPQVRADPDGRCAAFLIYGRKIVILPFRRDTAIVADDAAAPAPGEGGGGSVMASYVLDLEAVIQTNRVDNIIDLQFLHGYSQPTLLILYEPLKTFAGRIAVRKDTCRLDVVTLDVKERISAFIWSKEVLPFDCVRALPVPKPVGGTLVLAVNSLFYLNQGVPPHAVALNSLGENTVENVGTQPDAGRLTLDCSQARFMSPERAVISLKGGELYVLSLLVDGMRGVRGFHLDRAASSVLTTCLAVCEDDYLFLGSRLGNSLLLHFTEKDIDVAQQPAADKEPPVKKKRTDASGDWTASEDVDFEVYGRGSASANSVSKISSYTFEVCDSLLNIGPCATVCMGEPSFISEEFSGSVKADPDVELVSTSGHGKNGALCVLQQTVRPQVVTTFELPGCQNMWTVAGDGGGEADGHAFLILSRADSTMVLQTGEEINELDSSGFRTDSATVFTGNVGGNKYVLQLTETEVRLVHGMELLQKLPLDLSSPVVQASPADPHVLALAADGQMVLITLDDSVGVGQLSVVKTNLRSKSRIVAVAAYKDTSGLFTKDTPEESREVAKGGVPENKEEDEDDLLYGDSAPNLFAGAASAFTSENSEKKPLPTWVKYLKPTKPTFWAVGLRENGNLETMSLPDFTLKFVVKMFPLLPNVLSNSLAPRRSLSSAAAAADDPPPSASHPEGAPSVCELLMVGLGGSGRRRPLLLARLSDHEVVVYEAYPYYGPDADGAALKLRFRKLPHGMILRERKGGKKAAASASAASSSSGGGSTLRHFSDVAGYEGVFVCGPYPHWLILTGRGELRTHPMPIDGSVSCFAAFHNVNCPQGFIYFNRKSELRISVLPTHLSYDAPWPVRKVPLRCTPHHLAYHLASKTYAVVTSTSEATNKVWKFNGDDKELFAEERDDRFPLPAVDTFFLQLFSPVSWEPIPGTRLQLEDWERVTCLKHLYLSPEGLHSGKRGYVVAGTSFSYGEDVTPRGFVRIYDVIDVIPEPGQPLTKNKFKPVYEKEQKGPITSVAAVNGYLVASVGQKIYVFHFKDGDLFGVAFIDSQVYIHQLVTMKNFILVGDVMKSVDLMVFQEDYRTLAVVSRDTSPAEVYAVEYVMDNANCAFAVTDADKNVTLFMYLPEARESVGGQKLVRRADFHVGQHVNAMFRIRARITDPSAGSRLLTGWEKRHVLWFATLDGALGYVLPCSEKTYRRLLMLQNVLVNAIPHAAGLNPKSFRTLKQRRKQLVNPARGIIDGQLVFKFTDLPVTQKAEIAKKIGAKPADLMDDLAELDRMAAHF